MHKLDTFNLMFKMSNRITYFTTLSTLKKSVMSKYPAKEMEHKSINEQIVLWYSS